MESANVPMPAHMTPLVLYCVPPLETSRPFAMQESIVPERTGAGLTVGQAVSQILARSNVSSNVSFMRRFVKSTTVWKSGASSNSAMTYSGSLARL